MRERLLAAFVALTLLTILLYGVPRAFLRAGLVADEAQREVEREAAIVAEVVETRLRAGLPPAGAPLEFVDARDRVTLTAGSTVTVLAAAPEAEGPSTEMIDARRPVSTGTVEVRRPRAAVSRDVVAAIRPIVLTGLLALAAAVAAAVVLSARLARPFRLLAERAAALGRGDFDADVPPLRVQEAEAIADALRTSAARVAAMLARERQFARNASHQLRTPLTGMRLRVEDVTTWTETPEEVRHELEAVLDEIDRLSDTVTALLALSRDERVGSMSPHRLDDVVQAAAQRWLPLARQLERMLTASADAGDPGDATVPLPRVVVDQVLDVLVHNALLHGHGCVRLRAAADGDRVRFTVADEGEGLRDVDESQLFRRGSGRRTAAGGEGIGLSLCAALALGVGGRLSLSSRTPTAFELTVPTTT